MIPINEEFDQREMMKASAMEIGLTEDEAEDAIDVLGSDIEEYGEDLDAERDRNYQEQNMPNN